MTETRSGAFVHGYVLGTITSCWIIGMMFVLTHS